MKMNASGVIFVTTTEQKIKDRTESVGCSLQEAIFSANFDQAIAIASYATARDVPAARVVFCDAHPYDAGYLSGWMVERYQIDLTRFSR